MKLGKIIVIFVLTFVGYRAFSRENPYSLPPERYQELKRNVASLSGQDYVWLYYAYVATQTNGATDCIALGYLMRAIYLRNDDAMDILSGEYSRGAACVPKDEEASLWWSRERQMSIDAANANKKTHKTR